MEQVMFLQNSSCRFPFLEWLVREVRCLPSIHSRARARARTRKRADIGRARERARPVLCYTHTLKMVYSNHHLLYDGIRRPQTVVFSERHVCRFSIVRGWHVYVWGVLPHPASLFNIACSLYLYGC